MSIRVALVEDSEEFRSIVSDYFCDSKGFDLVAAYENGETALNTMVEHKPDVVLMDINLPGISGVECTRRMKEQLPNVQIMMLTGNGGEDYVFNSLIAGAAGYVTKPVNRETLLTAVEELHLGGSPMTPEIARKVVETFRQFHLPTTATDNLTNREKEILSLLATGLKYQQIADRLFINVETVRVHIHRIYSKLHVRTRAEAIVKTSYK